MKTAPDDISLATGAGWELFHSLRTIQGCDVLDKTGWQLYTSLSGCQADRMFVTVTSEETVTFPKAIWHPCSESLTESERHFPN
jgi:hypothetical protein